MKEQNIMLLLFLAVHLVKSRQKVTDCSRMNITLFASSFETQIASFRTSVHTSNNFRTYKHAPAGNNAWCF
jgi:hypothetical protein